MDQTTTSREFFCPRGAKQKHHEKPTQFYFHVQTCLSHYCLSWEVVGRGGFKTKEECVEYIQNMDRRRRDRLEEPL